MTLSLTSGISPIVYTSSNKHSLLSTDFLRSDGPNIGINGKNLTITFLALNRSQLTERLCSSISKHIPSFEGEVLAIDNGSNDRELRRLYEILEAQPFRSRVVSLGKNYGVAGGRNRTIDHVQTEWLMCLDNDIYFTRNPLEKIQSDLGMLGCKFANMPLLEPDGETLFSFGGHLYIELDSNDNLRLGHGGSAIISKPSSVEFQPQLSTFLFGGASVFECKAFKSMGGYDENMFVGFEDTDLSIRLFQAGMKVGTVGCVSLIHEHPLPSDDDARSYRKERYSPTAIEHSAKYMERKHGFNFWNDDLVDWVRSKHDAVEPRIENTKVTKVKLPRVALITDADNWAFANIARQVKKSLSDQYDIEVLHFWDFNGFFQLLLALEGYDLVHFFWRSTLDGMLNGVDEHRAKTSGIPDYYSFMREKLKGTAITTAVYDHLFLDKYSVEKYRSIFSQVDGYSVSSKILFNTYTSLEGFPIPSAILQDGVDLDHFSPSNLERFSSNLNRPLVIGWAGNSAWRPGDDGIDYKGLHSIIRPALSMLSENGIEFVEEFADKQIRLRSYSEMPEYYSSIDIYLCGSLIEGTPNPVLEAMACGIPVISTDVGIVSEVFGSEQRKFILKERTSEAMAKALMEISSNRQLLNRLSQENLESIQHWGWDKKASAFGDFFRGALEKKASEEWKITAID
ncbi:glycosyltransferase [Brucella anthropi]|jgi:glycosyltransferase involved in cell wall biosynthesis/GT2 family glycosyltransferase|uniref:glycosyltransferase n=1 Tax=Brucella anthropi TaxID=529 RepID=UPI00124E77C9|nr:glycosyltransferase [Brucella anthropi]KAB2748054.1 glycosyltransferase [Brucella anthropi]